MRKKLLVLSLLLISGASAKEVPEVQVTATRVEVPVEHVGDDVDIITQEEIKKYGFTSIADVLKYVAGVHVSTVGGPGQSPYSVYMLGLPTKHILVMIDGVPINDPSLMDTQANFSYIDLNNVERIEVLKGAQGALYGSEAIAGVINIITKKPKENEFKFGFEGGKYKTFKENIYSALKLKDGYLSLSVENFKTNGFSATNKKSPDFEPDSDKYSYRSGWISYGWNLSETFKVTGNFKLKEGTTEYDSNWTPDAYTTYSDYFAGIKIDKVFSDNFIVTTKLSNNKETRNYGIDLTGITRYISIQPTYYLSDSLFFTGGVNYKQEVTNTSGVPNLHTRSVFFEIHTDYLGTHNTFAVRRDFHSQFGAKTTYKVSSAYEIEKTGTTLKGQYGTGFKAPTMYQLYSPYGNSDLKPETSEGWIVGVKQDFSRLIPFKTDLEVNYFKNHVWNSIDYVILDWTTYDGKYENVKKELTEGAEVKISIFPIENLKVYGSYTHLRAIEFNQQWMRLSKRPKFSYTIGFNTNYQKLKLSAWAEHYSDREAGNGKTLKGFTTYNCYASYRLNDRVTFYLKGVNLTDKDYELAYGYNTMGRAFFAGVSLNFN